MYCVRPNTGKLQPGESAQVQVLLQQMAQDPPLDVRCKDKFLIQAIKISQDVMLSEGDDLTSNLLSLWRIAEDAKKVDPDHVDELKLRCVFLPSDIDDHKSEVDFGSILSNTTTPDETPIKPVKSVDSKVEIKPISFKPIELSFVKAEPVINLEAEKKPTLDTKKIASLPKSNSALISPLFALSANEVQDLQSTIKKLNEKCDTYKTEIEKLNTLRARKPDNEKDVKDKDVRESRDSKSVKGSVQETGVPIQTVALVAFMSFLFGVLFF